MLTLLLDLLWLSLGVSGLVVLVIGIQELRDWLAPKVRRWRGFDRAPRAAVLKAQAHVGDDHFATWESELASR